MRARFLASIAIGSLLLLSACDKKSGELDKGQVVATVDGHDITIHELNAELAFSNMPRDADRRQFEAAALQRIIDRKIISDIARERKLDKTQNFVLQKMRVEDMLLVAMLQRQLVSKLGPPSRTEAEAYIEAHPGMFAQRTIYMVDQITFQPTDIAMLKAIAPMKTLDQLQQFLVEKGARYRRAPGTLDAARMDPTMLEQLQKLPAGEVFVIPVRGELVASTIISSRIDPLIGEPAVRFAMGLVQRQRLQDVAKTQLDPEIKKARASVVYQKGYGPAKPDAGEGEAASQ